MKKWLSISFCSCAVVVVMVFSLAGQKETTKMAGKEMAVIRTLSGSHNRVTGGKTETSIELNRSRVTGEQETSGKQPNIVVDEPELLSPVQALLENNGENKQSETEKMRYQYPVQISDDVKQNYDGVQSAASDIKKAVNKTGVIGGPVSSGAISSGAISPAGIQTEGSFVSDVSPAGIQAEEEGKKDTVAPTLAFEEEKYLKIQGKDKTIYCTNDNTIPVTASDQADGTAGTGVEKICYAYGDTLMYCIDPSRNRGIQISENFYGKITASCFDAAGNGSDSVSRYFLVEKQAPEIQFSQDAFCTAPYTFWVNIRETGNVVSGIRDVKCTVNGKPYDITNLTMLEKTLLDEDLEVPTGCEFSLPFAEEGDYSVVVTVTDNAGNTSTEEKIVQVTKPELISVFMPEKFAIHIDPQRLAGREQIYSDDIILKNDSDFDVQVTVKKVEVVIENEVSETGIKKDCDLYMIAPDTGKKIPLKKGENKNVYSYCLKRGAKDMLGKIRFVGDTAEGSDAMWKDSDVVIRADLGFSKKGMTNK